MKIKAVSEVTGLSDRTIRYYIEQELIFPSFKENYLGRKAFDFSQDVVEELKNISILRRFDFKIEEIREIIRDSEASKSIIKNAKVRIDQEVAAGQMRQFTLSQIDDEKPYTLAELAQELLEASKNLPKKEERIKKNIGKVILVTIKAVLIFILVWLPVAFQFLFFVVTVNVYEYPKFYPSAILYMSISILPTLLMLLLGKIKNSWKRRVQPILLVLCMISLLCSLLVSKLPVGIMAESVTTDFKEYRDVDPDCLANRDSFFQELFPGWPHYFENVIHADGRIETVYLDAHYYYRYLSIMDYTYDIYAEWPLEKEVFEQEVARVTELFETNAPSEDGYWKYLTLQKGSYNCLVLYEGDPVFEEATDNYTYYIFAYDKENLKVRYLCSCSLENGADQPYYLLLDW